ncbi:MAG: hypothetical protein JW982_02055 [Spirochaetes bacterium]|nr:hypothetical protein [Spirochaetota bacterium]
MKHSLIVISILLSFVFTAHAEYNFGIFEIKKNIPESVYKKSLLKKFPIGITKIDEIINYLNTLDFSPNVEQGKGYYKLITNQQRLMISVVYDEYKLMTVDYFFQDNIITELFIAFYPE